MCKKISDQTNETFLAICFSESRGKNSYFQRILIYSNFEYRNCTMNNLYIHHLPCLDSYLNIKTQVRLGSHC